MNIVKELRKGAGFESHHRHQSKNPAPIKGSGFFFFIAFFCGVIFDRFSVIFDGFPVKFEKQSGHENGHEKAALWGGTCQNLDAMALLMLTPSACAVFLILSASAAETLIVIMTREPSSSTGPNSAS